MKNRSLFFVLLIACASLAAPLQAQQVLRKTDIGTTPGTVAAGDADKQGNTLYVDAVNGIDTTGARGRRNLPYLTLSAAQAAASSGDKITVSPGSYTVSAALGKNGVNWEFLPGANVSSSSSGIFADGASTALTFTVAGSGNFSTSSNSAAAIYVQNASSNITINAGNVTATGTNAFGARVDNGAFVLNCQNLTTSDATSTAYQQKDGNANLKAKTISGAGGVYIASGGTSSTATCEVNAYEIIGTAGSAIRSASSQSEMAVWVNAKKVSGGNNAIFIDGGKLYVNAQKVFTTTGGLPVVQWYGEASISHLYLTAQKITVPDSSGTYALAGASDALASFAWIDVLVVEFLGQGAILFEGTNFGANLDTAVIHIADVTPTATSAGCNITGASTVVLSGRINTSLNSAAPPITLGSGAIALALANCTLIGPSSGNSITATAAQTVSVTGSLSANRSVGSNVTLDFSSNLSGASGGSGAQNLVPTAVKTAAYSAAPGDLIPVNATSASVPITLPTAPANGTRIAAKLIAVSGSYNATLTCGGSDKLNIAGGNTTLTLSLLNQAVVLQYAATPALWYVTDDDLPLAQLDARYATAAQGTLAGTAVQPATAPALTGTNFTGIPESAVTNLTTDLAAKSPLASPALTGTPTAPTQTAGDNSTKVATTNYADRAVSNAATSYAPATGSTAYAPAANIQTYSGTGGTVTINSGTTILLLQTTLTSNLQVTLSAASGGANGTSIQIIDPAGYSSGTYIVTAIRALSDTVNGSSLPQTVLYGQGARTIWRDGVSKWSTANPLAERTFLGAIGTADSPTATGNWTFSNTIYTHAGAYNDYSIQIGSNAGLYNYGPGQGVAIELNGGSYYTLFNVQGVCTSRSYLWGPSIDTRDTMLSRLYAGALSIDTTTAGNALGSLKLTSLIASGPTTYSATLAAAGATGNVTVNKPGFSVRFATSASTSTPITITNSNITANSIITPVIETYGTGIGGVTIVCSSGAANLYPNAPPTAETEVRCIVNNTQ